MIDLLLTEAGRTAIVNAQVHGTGAVNITACQVGSAQYEPDAAQTALKASIKQMPAIAGSITDPTVLHLTAQDTTNDAYSVGEIGFFLEDGTLFAVGSSSGEVIADKAAASQLLISYDVVIIDAGDLSELITVTGDGFLNPQATESTQGIARIATDADVAAGIDDEAFITSKKLAPALIPRSHVGMLLMTFSALTPKQLGYIGTWEKLPDDVTILTGTPNVAPVGTNNPAAPLLQHSHTFTGKAHTHGFTGVAHTHTFTGKAHGHTFKGAAHHHGASFKGRALPPHTHMAEAQDSGTSKGRSGNYSSKGEVSSVSAGTPSGTVTVGNATVGGTNTATIATGTNRAATATGTNSAATATGTIANTGTVSPTIDVRGKRVLVNAYYRVE
ncbi:tail-collar fiber protein [Sinobacterium caligoides]|uniref:Tail-collar fiber protein n=1 Tax=Sinobacterium caligoides TaxID=933926 RepID=A0A3N2E102_9GAMM|nr:phage tail protein [Sinobacterium caligoides]ROS05707.1 tail-collar fiber protein [Sinobacterium caligoides]